MTRARLLVAQNDVPLPSDQGEPDGCCLTLSGSVTFTPTTYDLRTSHRIKNNSGDEVFAYVLGPGTVSAAQDTVTLHYGDEGPGSNQIRATFRRAD